MPLYSNSNTTHRQLQSHSPLGIKDGSAQRPSQTHARTHTLFGRTEYMFSFKSSSTWNNADMYFMSFLEHSRFIINLKVLMVYSVENPK